MGWQAVILGSDLLFFVLIALSLLGAVWARRRPDLVRAWRRVAESDAAMASMTVLAALLVVGVLDSLHYRAALPGAPGQPVMYAAQVDSALDALTRQLSGHTEKTYSAPFAAHLYAKETIDLPDGRQMRAYPRLAWGGRHLPVPERDRPADIARGLAAALALAVTLSALLGLLLMRPWRHGALARAWRHFWRAEDGVKWRAVWLAASALCIVFVPLLLLSGDYHVLGTDKVGQDILYQALKSVRTAWLIGTLTTLIMLPFAIFLGIYAGYRGGLADDIVQYLYTTLNSIPGVLLIAASVLMMQVLIDTHPEWFATAAERADARLLALCAILGMTSWTGLCRLLRGEALKLRELDYVQAARAFGVSRARILVRHILPNVMHIVLISIAMDFSGLVLSEAVLSYIGIGVDPSMQSFGTMINSARMELSREPMVWWSLATAFVFLFVLVLAANLFADAVRDALDPRLASPIGGRA
ncbi:MAG: hypothetical protein AMXMBFR6_21830 [Betaproteobacteria bacterium]|nr:ABC transporter permease [Rhodocyclaceae bacterium]